MRATKSVSELTSTAAPDVTFEMTPIRPCARDAIGLLGSLGQALLAQEVDRGLHVAVGFLQCLLAIHHAGAGLVAQLLNGCGGNRAHACSFRAGAR